MVYVTPFAQTVHEDMWDDGSAELGVNAGSGQWMAVKYTACSAGESLVRFKWYQTEEAGAFYLKVFANDNGMPGDELFSRVVAGGLLQGWNEYDLSGEGLLASSSRMARCPWPAAKDMAEAPNLFSTAGSAPASNNIFTISTWPSCTA